MRENLVCFGSRGLIHHNQKKKLTPCHGLIKYFSEHSLQQNSFMKSSNSFPQFLHLISITLSIIFKIYIHGLSDF